MKRTAALHVVEPTPSKKKKPDARVGLMNPSFKYVKAAETDIRKTFAKIKREGARGAK
jgi:hypothetical protein